MQTIIIAAVAADLGIGHRGNLLWHIREDLQHFKTLTKGHAVIMGRLTWESLPKRPLPGRMNIVVSRNPGYVPEGGVRVGSIEEGIACAEAEGHSKVFIIGGGEIYKKSLPLADTLELTEIEAIAPDCDTYFPDYRTSDWILADDQSPVVATEPSVRFRRYERRPR